MEFNKLDRQVEFPDRWKVRRDTINGNWKILDMWHPYFENVIDIDAVLPDDSPCLKIISDGELGALLTELKKAGIIQKIVGTSSQSPEIKEVVKEVFIEQKKSEDLLLKEKVIDSMLKLAGMQEVSKVSKV